MSRSHGNPASPPTKRQQRRRPLNTLPPLPNSQQRPNERPNHRVAERISRHKRRDHPVNRRPHQLKPLQFPDGRSPFTPLAERAKVVLPQQKPRSLIHRRNVQRTRPGQGVQPPQRMRSKGSIGNAVLVVPPHRGEPGVKGSRHHPSGEHPHIRGQRPRQPLGQPGNVNGVRQISVSDLTGGVHPRIGAPGHGQRDVLPQDHRQRVLENAADGPPGGLPRPPGELGPVVP
ncbi:hypothetical protein DFR72_105583 [Lentzea flaviverrucosa]|uniref:Uncharacterized protein n=1 Tax=Lentzea flaviverrucosa TaxID=200379 RepID=A0A1H9XYB6_9PSEU|nr:hypothetical protein DFR72_105583 [Lentzea flaviverrucosa]SES51145.1 hypothetical protein SAMN05216195_12612 [Lentzea flaviverrucosa]